MAKAVTCPVCAGFGKFIKQNPGSTNPQTEESCHGCYGRGWVEVSEDIPKYIPQYNGNELPQAEPGRLIPLNDRPCMHDSCTKCGGTGIRKDGLGTCIHMMSCPCPKCTPRM